MGLNWFGARPCPCASRTQHYTQHRLEPAVRHALPSQKKEQSGTHAPAIPSSSRSPSRARDAAAVCRRPGQRRPHIPPPRNEETTPRSPPSDPHQRLVVPLPRAMPRLTLDVGFSSVAGVIPAAAPLAALFYVVHVLFLDPLCSCSSSPPRYRAAWRDRVVADAAARCCCCPLGVLSSAALASSSRPCSSYPMPSSFSRSPAALLPR